MARKPVLTVRSMTPVTLAVSALLAVASPPDAAAQTPLWTRQLGTTTSDYGFGVAVDGAGNAYITGGTFGSLGGPNAGSGDAFLARYDGSGGLLWTRQFGTTSDDVGGGVAVDGAGNAYITGATFGSLGGPSAGIYDAYLAKYDASGVLLWTRQLGTTSLDQGIGVAADDAGNAYIAGYTLGSLGGPNAGSVDVFLARCDTSGALLWTRQFGTTESDVGYGVAVDGAGDAYITGSTLGSLGGPNAGEDDAFLVKYDASGALLKTRQFGTTSEDRGNGVDVDVDVDGARNAYIAGFTYGSLGGANGGFQDAFLARYVACHPCDTNCDGSIDAFDIEPFVDLLVGPNPTPCAPCTGDANGDGVIDTSDIEPFLQCLFP
jgi:hypothetical protein